MKKQLILGLGCDRGTSLDTIECAIELALETKQLNKNDISQFASIDKKQDEVAFLALAEKHQLPFSFYPAAALAQVDVPSPSAVVLKYMGTPSVSEAAALLAANTTMEHLIVEKYKYRGADEKNATVSIVIQPIQSL